MINCRGHLTNFSRVQGKAVWSLEGENIWSLAASETRDEVALGRQDGSVQLWKMTEWTLRATFHTKSGGTALQYGSIGTRRQSNVPSTFLIVRHREIQVMEACRQYQHIS